MNADHRYLALSHLWLFQANVEPTTLDTTGAPLAQSLAELLAKQANDGRREAAGHFMQAHLPRNHDIDDVVTGSYDANVLHELLQRSAGAR